MNVYSATLGKTERVIYKLRGLYEQYGYSQYKMSKFEEYDLYVRNKSFLQSASIITFTDTDGKLMALKPDVTLSIIKNSKDTEGGVRKVYYNENVYRVPRGELSYREIMQAGLECMGEIDAYSISEVLGLAAKSLSEISDEYVLDVSDLDILSSLMDELGIKDGQRSELLCCIAEKNTSEIDKLCFMNSEAANVIKALVSLKGGSDEMLEVLKGRACYDEACEFARTLSMLQTQFGARIRIDFSVIDDTSYYNGIVFKGFVRSIPTAVLSGGRYDGRVKRMKKNGGALGFAVYLDKIDQLECDTVEYDVDTFVQYSNGDSADMVYSTVEALTKKGERVLAGKRIPEKLKYRTLIKLGEE